MSIPTKDAKQYGIYIVVSWIGDQMHWAISIPESNGRGWKAHAIAGGWETGWDLDACYREEVFNSTRGLLAYRVGQLRNKVEFEECIGLFDKGPLRAQSKNWPDTEYDCKMWVKDAMFTMAKEKFVLNGMSNKTEQKESTKDKVHGIIDVIESVAQQFIPQSAGYAAGHLQNETGLCKD
jgi:hypothetical protein